MYFPLSSHCRTVLGASRSRQVAAQTLTRLREMRIGLANGPIPGSGETEFRHVPSAACLQCPPRRSPAPVHRPVPRQRRQPPGHPARPRRHALRPALRRRQPPPAAGRPRVPLIRAMGPFAGPSTRHTCRRPGESRDPALMALKAGFQLSLE